MKVPDWFFQQAGAIPVAYRNDGWELLLITSRNKQNWIIPKGVIDPGSNAAETALKESYEEAGVRGNLSPGTVGRYTVDKWGGTCTVDVYLLEVSEELEDWPEQAVRQRRWMALEEALDEVNSEELRRLIKQVPAYLDDWRRRIPYVSNEMDN